MSQLVELNKDIECRVVQVTYNSTGHKAAGLVKLLKDGVEIPTARKIWVDFVITNDENTPYHVYTYELYNGVAYDVTISDEEGKVIYYDGHAKRLRQNEYARKHNLPLPADTIEMERQQELQRQEAIRLRQEEQENRDVEKRTVRLRGTARVQTLNRLRGTARVQTLNRLKKPSTMSHWKSVYGLTWNDRFNEEQLYEIYKFYAEENR